MNEEERSSSPKRAPVKEFFGDVARLPGWQRNLLVVAGVLGIGGLVGQASSRVSRTPPSVPPAAVAPAGQPVTDSGAPRSRAFADAPPGDPATPVAAPVQVEPPPLTLYERLSPWAVRVGLGFVGGFVIGWAFRAFLKTMAVVTAVGAALFWGLAHFDVLNVDVGAAEARFRSSTSWVSAKAAELKDAAMTLVPSSASSLFGMFLGFRRR